MKDDELHCLEGVREVHIDKGEIISHQGELEHYFWILLEGDLRVFQKTAEQHELTLSKIDAGNAFGELRLLTNVPNGASIEASSPSHLLQLDEEQFWSLMTSCPQVRKAILGNMAERFQKLQSVTVQQEEDGLAGYARSGSDALSLNNPGSAARRAASQLRENLLRMHELSLKFKERELTTEQKHCMFDLQKQALATKQPLMMNSLDQSDAEEALAEWMEAANIENAWKMAPTLVSVGMNAAELERVRNDFDGTACWVRH